MEDTSLCARNRLLPVFSRVFFHMCKQLMSILWKGVVQLFRHAQDFADNKHLHKKGRVHTRSTVVSGTGAGHQHPGRTICGTS